MKGALKLDERTKFCREFFKKLILKFIVTNIVQFLNIYIHTPKSTWKFKTTNMAIYLIFVLMPITKPLRYYK